MGFFYGGDGLGKGLVYGVEYGEGLEIFVFVVWEVEVWFDNVGYGC